MNKVNNAIILAAGKGKRLRPVTLDTPKPLVRVNGVRMIDTEINALLLYGIDDICVVTGYLPERFSELKQDYPMLRFIENPYYETCNNISSLYVARELLGDTMILDGDLIIRDPSVLEPHFEMSGYNAVWTDAHTDEWLMQAEEGIVKKCSRTGGENGWQLYSISRWSKNDSAKLRKHLEYEFEVTRRTDIYWDDLAMFLYPEEYVLGIKKMTHDAVDEIDSLDELISVDKSYRGFAMT